MSPVVIPGSRYAQCGRRHRWSHSKDFLKGTSPSSVYYFISPKFGMQNLDHFRVMSEISSLQAQSIQEGPLLPRVHEIFGHPPMSRITHPGLGDPKLVHTNTKDKYTRSRQSTKSALKNNCFRILRVILNEIDMSELRVVIVGLVLEILFFRSIVRWRVK